MARRGEGRIKLETPNFCHVHLISFHNFCFTEPLQLSKKPQLKCPSNNLLHKQFLFALRENGYRQKLQNTLKNEVFCDFFLYITDLKIIIRTLLPSKMTVECEERL